MFIADRPFDLTRYSTKIITWTLVCTFLIACEGKRAESTDTTQDKEVYVDSLVVEETFPDVASKHIRIVPTMHSVFSDINTVHCSNIEYLWSAIMANADKDISANSLAKEFSQSQSWENSLDTSKLVLAFGRPHDVYENVIQQYMAKYKINKNDLIPQGSTFWGYTDKVVNYRYAEPFDEQRLQFLGTEVSAFGFNSEFESAYIKDYFKDQFDILYFNADGEFVVRLKPANTTDEIILSMLKKRGTFFEMFKKSKDLIKKGDSELKRNALIYNLNTEDELIIPVIKFKAYHSYSEVNGLEFSSKYGPIDVCEQTIKFNFDRKGVVLEAEVSIPDSVGMPQKPKLLHFDKPFYLYIKEANATHPYFNLWVSDTEILERKKGVTAD